MDRRAYEWPIQALLYLVGQLTLPLTLLSCARKKGADSLRASNPSSCYSALSGAESPSSISFAILRSFSIGFWSLYSPLPCSTVIRVSFP